MSLRVPLADVRPDPKQPRTYFRPSALAALGTSIKKHGQRQSITVRDLGANAQPRYEIIDGERRWRACQQAGIPKIRIEVEERELSSHADQHRLSLTSNFMREDHTHMEIALAVKYQVDAAVEAGRPRARAIEELSEAIGKSEAWIYNYLQLQDLCPTLQELLHPDVPNDKRLRFNEAMVLAPLLEATQKSIYRRLLRYPPGARAALARKFVTEATGKPQLRRSGSVKVSTTRFLLRVTAEIERVLDYKQADFEKALQSVPTADLIAFRGFVGLLLDSVDRATAKLKTGARQ